MSRFARTLMVSLVVMLLITVFMMLEQRTSESVTLAPSLGVNEALFLPFDDGGRPLEPGEADAALVEPPRDWVGAQRVELPDVWGYLRPQAGDQVWYQIRIDSEQTDAMATTGVPIWVLVERVRSSVQAYAGDQLIWSSGRLRPPIARSGAEPHAFAVPIKALAQSGFRLSLRVRAAPGERGGLGLIRVGTHEQIERVASRLRFWNVNAVHITSAVIVATSLFILLLRWQIPNGLSGYPVLAAAGFVWGVRNLNLVMVSPSPDRPMVAFLWQIFATCGNGWVIGLLGLFLTRHFTQRQFPKLTLWLNWLIPAFMALGPLLLLTSLPRAEMIGVWLAISAPVILVTIGGLARFVWREPTLTHIGFLGFFVGMIVLHAYDNYTLRSPTRFGESYVSHFAGVLFFLMVAQVLVSRYGGLMRDYRSLNASLEQRLKEQQDQLTLQHLALAKLEAERVKALERSRIMRDLHDGLGSQLTAALYQTRAEGALRIESILQECLDDLRLAIYSLEPSSGYVATVLGTLRQRLMPALAAAGIDLVWDVEDVGRVPSLDSSQILDLLRIVQEAITNAIKHAQAKRIRLGLALREGRVQIEIEDDGCGIDLAAAAAKGGRGIGNMRRRAMILGARLDLTNLGRGTRVVLDLTDRVVV